MKNIFLGRIKTFISQIIIVLYFVLACTTTYAKVSSGCAIFFDHDGNATQALSNLLNVTKIQTKESKNIHNHPDIKNWRTHPGLERWDLKLPNKLKTDAYTIINICQNKLGMQEQVSPKNIKYSGVLFLGASFNGVVDRAEFYSKLVSEKVIDKNLKLWVLTGERKLNKKAGETEENFLKLVPPGQKPLTLPLNELEMIKFVLHYKIPKTTTVEYIYSIKDPKHTRATTASTTYVWAKKIPASLQKSYYLGISNQPYVNYQESVINQTLEKIGRKNIEVHVIGSAAQQPNNPDNHAAILLDAVSKVIANCSEEFTKSKNDRIKKK